MGARSLCLLLCLGAAPALSHQAPVPAATPDHHARKPDERFTLKPLRGGVHALYGRGGNVGFLVGPEAVLVVDSQYKDMAPGIVEQIRSVTDKPIKFLVNTHHHGDHTGGNDTFRPLSVIIAHDNVRKRMLASPQDILRDYPARAADARKAGREDQAKNLEEQIAWAKTVKVEEIPAPIVTYDSELRVHVNGETVQVWHTPPAHTDGDSSVYFEKANVLHMGDLFFHKYVPFIDVRSGGSPRRLPEVDRRGAGPRAGGRDHHPRPRRGDRRVGPQAFPTVRRGRDRRGPEGQGRRPVEGRLREVRAAAVQGLPGLPAALQGQPGGGVRRNESLGSHDTDRWDGGPGGRGARPLAPRRPPGTRG